MSKFIDLTGQKFGRLTVIKRIENDKYGHTRWMCLCDCQKLLPEFQRKYSYVDGNNLKRGKIKSCGCLSLEIKHSRKHDLRGKIFGRLTVVDYKGDNKFGDSLWECLCSCQNDLPEEERKTCIVSRACLEKGITSSCGCLRKEVAAKKARKNNKFDLSNDYGIGYTNKGEIFYFDLDDYDLIKNHCWHIDSFGVVVANINKRPYPMHKLIMSSELEIDHIDGHPNNNRKINLRPVSHQQNMMNQKLNVTNTSGHKGVSYYKRTKKWTARIGYNNQKIWLGSFDDINDAIAAREKAEQELFGEYNRAKEFL